LIEVTSALKANSAETVLTVVTQEQLADVTALKLACVLVRAVHLKVGLEQTDKDSLLIYEMVACNSKPPFTMRHSTPTILQALCRLCTDLTLF
jgi:hypothetical protein